MVSQLRLNQEQRQEKETAEAAIEDLKEQITLAEGDDAKAELQAKIDTQQTTLSDLMENFAVGFSAPLKPPHIAMP